jgi:hypothetical protein
VSQYPSASMSSERDERTEEKEMMNIIGKWKEGVRR